MVGYNQFGVLWQILGKFLTSQTYVVIYHAPKFTKLNKLDMDVSKNRSTPKSSILIGFSIINHPFWGTTIFGNTHMLLVNPLSLLCDAIFVRSCSFRQCTSVVFQKTYHLSSNNIKNFISCRCVFTWWVGDTNEMEKHNY